MKTFMKQVIACFALFAGAAVHAQCVPPNGEYRNPYSGFIENAPRIYDPQQRCYVPQGTQLSNQGNQGLQVLANQAIRIPVGGQIPQGYCSWDERLKNVGLSTVLGGIFGALAGDTNRAAGQGAAAGLLVGTMVPCAAQQQYLQQQGGQQVVQRQQGTVTEQSLCNIEGMNPIRGISAEDCKKLNGHMTIQVPASCNIEGMNPIQGISREECAKLASHATVKVPAATTRAEVTPAYCILKRTRNGQTEVKNVLNPVRQQSYCDELPSALQNGTKIWENLQVVNL